MFVILYNQCINVFIISLAHIRMLYVSLHLSWLRVLVSNFTFDVFIDCFGFGIMRRTQINLNKFALLGGEAQLILPYVCLQNKIA